MKSSNKVQFSGLEFGTKKRNDKKWKKEAKKIESCPQKNFKKFFGTQKMIFASREVLLLLLPKTWLLPPPHTDRIRHM